MTMQLDYHRGSSQSYLDLIRRNHPSAGAADTKLIV